ncbi:DUF6303 family protein [Streptomyces sp. NPDC096136]|uniref:DUF6303 family protein n=1 Tax=Streptomyces sp. NPDC096136 TaxID=3366076 RepID=UPI0037FB8EF5
MSRRPLLAHLLQQSDGSWRLWVDVPGVTAARQPSTVLPAGPGPSVAARAAALARLGFEPARPGQTWTWTEVAPSRCVDLVGTMPVGAVSVASPPAPRRGGAGAQVRDKAAAPKRAAAAARPAPEPAARRAGAEQPAPRRRPAAPSGRAAAVTPPPTALALPAGPAARAAVSAGRARPAALPAGVDRHPDDRPPAAPPEVERRQALALPPTAPRVPTVLDQLLSPRHVQEERRR